MSILQLDSWDGYVTSEIPLYWSDQSISGAAAITSASRTGVGALQTRPGGVARDIGINLFHAIIGVAFNSSAAATGFSTPIAQFSQGISGGVQCLLQSNGNGTVGIIQSSNGALLATTDPAGPLLQPGIYSYIEWSTGFVSGLVRNQIWINGEIVLDMNLATRGQPTSGASTVWLLGAGGGSVNIFDDYYLINPDDGMGATTQLGDSSVICMRSSANGDVNQWLPTPNTNANWVNVHEIPFDGDVTYNQGAGGFLEDYQVSPPLQLNDGVFAAQFTTIVKATGGEQARPYLVIQGVSFEDIPDTFSPAAIYLPFHHIYEQNPAINGAWAYQAINNTNWGLKEV